MSKGTLIIMMMIGVFATLVGVMGFIRSPEIVDAIQFVSGLVIITVGLYKLVASQK